MTRSARRIRGVLILFAALGVALAASASRSATAEPGAPGASSGPTAALNENMVQNPGAEANAGRASQIVKPKKWETSGKATARAYGAGDYPPTSESTRIGGGKNFFVALAGADSTASQRVNVTGQDDAIDRGELQVVFSAYLADTGEHKNPARARLRFLNASNKLLGKVELKSVADSDGEFIRRSASAAIPRGTRFFEVVLLLGRGGDVYVDNVSAVMGLERPQPGAYRLVRIADQANVGNMLIFSMIPGSTTDAVVGTRFGQLYRVKVDGSGSRNFFGDIRGLMKGGLDGEEGLLGFAFSPEYEMDRTVYLHYTAPAVASGSVARSTLARFKVASGKLDMGSRQTVMTVDQPYSNHNGGAIKFGPDGYLYWSLGDGGSGGDPQWNSQNLGRLLGKILRIDVQDTATYRIPADNPFVNRAGARKEIWAYGLRNMFRINFDRETGELWGGDVGQNRYEEVDEIVKGGNYGWAIMEGYACYRPSSGCNTSGLRMPRATYGRGDGCSVMGGVVSRGPSLPELDGWYVYGDYCTGKLFAANTKNSTSAVMLLGTGLNITDIEELPNGDIVLVTFNGAIYRLASR